MKEGKPTSDYQFLESYGLTRTTISSDRNNYSDNTNSGHKTTTTATTIGPLPLYQRPPRTMDKENDWFSYNEYNNQTTVRPTTTNNPNKQPLKKILKNKNDFMIPIVRTSSNSDSNNLSGDIKQSMSQTNLKHQQLRAVKTNFENKRSPSRTKAYYILLFIALYGLFGFVSYLSIGVMEVIRRIQVFRDGGVAVVQSEDGNSISTLNPISSIQDPITSNMQADLQETIDTIDASSSSSDQLNKQKSEFNTSPSNPVSNDMKDIITSYTDKTLALSENLLFSIFRDVSDSFDFNANKTNEKDFPFFWLIPPYTAGGHRITRIMNECFDLTRADVTGSNKHTITYNSQTRNSNEKEQILVGSNLFDLHKFFHTNDPIHQKGRMFAFFFHPIQRSAYLFETFKNSDSAPKEFQKMDLVSFANYILNETKDDDDIKKHYRYKVSNWMTRLLSQTPTGELSKYHVDAATLVLSKKCYVGLFDKMEDSIKRIMNVFHWDESSPGGRLGTTNCLEEFYGTDFVRDLVIEGSEDWKALESINKWDIMLYENIVRIFKEQKLLLFPPN